MRLLALALIACGVAGLAGCGGFSGSKPVQKGGGYYQDDGPGANPPADIASIREPEPRVEPLNRGANNRYTVFGHEYVPARELKPFKQRGTASWYGRKFHGQRTSSGETYDMYAMSAAHTTLPIPSYARVTNVANGRSVIVRVNDRGPFHSGRIIDLSYAAAYKLGYVNNGSATVEVEQILPQDMPSIINRMRGRSAAQAQASEPPPPSTPLPPPAPEIKPAEAQPIPIAAEAGGIYLQLGAFSSRDNAESFRARLQQQMSWLKEAIGLFQREDGLYRLHLGPYRDRAEAREVADKMREAMSLQPVVVVR